METLVDKVDSVSSWQTDAEASENPEEKYLGNKESLNETTTAEDNESVWQIDAEVSEKPEEKCLEREESLNETKTAEDNKSNCQTDVEDSENVEEKCIDKEKSLYEKTTAEDNESIWQTDAELSEKPEEKCLERKESLNETKTAEYNKSNCQTDVEDSQNVEEKCLDTEKSLYETTIAEDKDSTAIANQKGAKKRQAPVKVYGYMKKKVLNYMEENGCSARSVDTVINASKFHKESILDYMNQRMQLSQQHVHEECNSLSFVNIEKWLEYFKAINLPESCIYEPALVINAIVDNEDMPDADALDGIDLKSVYKFVANGLLGLPQPQLNQKSAQFLSKEFEIVVSSANTDFGDKETLRLNQKLLDLKELPCLKRTEVSSVDPLGLSDYQKES